MTQKIRICTASDLQENRSVKFSIPAKPENREGFALRKNGVVHAFFNECAHIPLALDWDDNDFFTLDFSKVVCKNHGAEYEIETGKCLAGPCPGAVLKKIDVIEEGGSIWALVNEK